MDSIKKNDVQSTRIQRKQWLNLMKFNATKNSSLGKGEIHSPNNKTTEQPYVDKVYKSAPIKSTPTK